MAAKQVTRKPARRRKPARKPTLIDALAKARAKVAAVPKLGTNTAQSYRYARAEDVIIEARKALAAAGLVLTDEVASYNVEPITSRAGGTGRLTDVRVRYVLYHRKSGESIVREWLGSGSDYPGDKATYKAITGAHKYFLIHLLEIPTGDDPEDERAAKPTARKAPPTGKGDRDPVIAGAMVTKIGKAIADRSLGFDRLRTLVGSVGGDAPKQNSSASIAKAVRALDAGQADQLLALIEAE